MSPEQCFYAAAITMVVIGAFWVLVDAYDHAEYPCVWFVMVMLFFPLALPLYIFLRMYSARSASRRVREQRRQERDAVPMVRFASDIERAKFIEAAQGGAGTLFSPPNLPKSEYGYAHFQVDRAERMIGEARYQEAFNYLVELYQMARDENDLRAVDTYRHYIARLPQGLTWLQQWEVKKRDRDRLPPSREKRDLPF
jgi:hypothetical protein